MNRDDKIASENESEAVKVAARGIRTMRHLANFSLATAVDVLHGRMGNRDAGAVLGGVRETRRNIQVGVAIGQNKDVIDAPGTVAAIGSHDPELAEEVELTAKLKALRERRNGVAKN